MSVVGFDFGSLSMLIGQAGKGGVDVVLNDASNRQTATAVSISGKQRFIGDSGAAMARSNVKNTITMVKYLVGRQFDDPDVQYELSRLPFESIKLPSGGVGIKVMYNDTDTVVPAEHFMAMMLTKAMDVAIKANNGLEVADSVIAVPFWFTESQRRGVMNACVIAGLNCLKVANESCTIALSYGIFKSAKQLFSETESTHVMFIDVGYSCYSVTVVDFMQENMKVLSTVCDKTLGGRDFDDVIVEFLAEAFQKKTGIDVRKNKKAVLKMLAAAEKAKKTLSPTGVNESNVSVECLAEDMDLNAMLTKEEFEKRCAPLFAKLAAPIQQALSEAKLSKEQVKEVEIVGGTSRIGAIKRHLSDILGLDASAINNGLKTTMNSDEAVARGCALQAAILSSRMKVKPFNIVDKMCYGVLAHFEAGETAADDNAAGGMTYAALYSRGDDVPHKPRRLTFKNKVKDFSVTLTYDDAAAAMLPPGENRFLGKYNIHVPAEFSAPNTSPCDVRITWNLDKNGLVFISSAQLLQEIVPTGDDATESAPTETKEGEEAAPAKKKFKKVDLQYTVEYPGLTRDEVKVALETEASMAFEDKLIVETADKKNELEAFIYTMRDRIDGPLKKFAKTAESDKVKAALTESEDWLYNDGYEASKGQYQRKLDELKTLSNPVEARFNASNERQTAIDALKKQLDLCKGFAANYDEKFSHITEEDRAKVRDESNRVEAWMYDSMAKQGDLALNEDPILTSESIKAQRSTLYNVCNPIMTKPKPKSAETKSEAAPEAEKKEDTKPAEEKQAENGTDKAEDDK